MLACLSSSRSAQMQGSEKQEAAAAPEPREVPLAIGTRPGPQSVPHPLLLRAHLAGEGRASVAEFCRTSIRTNSDKWTKSLDLKPAMFRTAVVNDRLHFLRVWYSIHLNFHTALSRTGYSERANPKESLKKILSDLYVANIGNHHVIRVLAENSLSKGYSLIGNRKICPPALNPPDQQNEQAEPIRENEQTAKQEQNRSVPEHRGVIAVECRFGHVSVS
jgi:hypothetical protein